MEGCARRAAGNVRILLHCRQGCIRALRPLHTCRIRSFLPAAGTGAPAEDFGTIAGNGPDNAWLLSTSLSHWNGTGWRSTALPANELGSVHIALDGHGRVWMQQWQEAGTAIIGTSLARYDGGQWSQQKMPALRGNDVVQLAALCSVPGSLQLFGAGWVSLTNSGPSGAILKYGP